MNTDGLWHWLARTRDIQWDYESLIRRNGRLERLFKCKAFTRTYGNNDGFTRWMSDSVFGLTYEAAPRSAGEST